MLDTQLQQQQQETISDRFKKIACHTGQKMDPEKMLSDLNDKIAANPKASEDVKALLSQSGAASLKDYFDANKGKPEAIQQLFGLLKNDGVEVQQPHHKGHHGQHSADQQNVLASNQVPTDVTKTA